MLPESNKKGTSAIKAHTNIYRTDLKLGLRDYYVLWDYSKISGLCNDDIICQNCFAQIIVFPV